MIKQEEFRVFYHLDNGEIYLIEKGFCDNMYCIKTKGKDKYFCKYVLLFIPKKIGKIIKTETFEEHYN